MNGATCLGTALTPESRVWFTLTGGILSGIRFPDIDRPCIRDLELIVTDGKDFFSREKKDAVSRTAYLEPAFPAFRVITTCDRKRYRIDKEILTDPERDALLQKTVFSPLEGALGNFRLYVLLTPWLQNRSEGSKAWWGDYKGVPMLFAEYADAALALACSAGWARRSVGLAGAAEDRHLPDDKKISQIYAAAEGLELALIGEIDLPASRGEFTLSIGFGEDRAEAGLCARAALLNGYEPAGLHYIAGWNGWMRRLSSVFEPVNQGPDLVRVGAAVLKTRESKRFRGGFISDSDGEDDGLPVVRVRELIESAAAFLAAGLIDEFLATVLYLETTQEADGHWPRDQWLDGTPCRNATALNETALPLLLIGLGLREGALQHQDALRLWSLTRRAGQYLVMNGPVSVEERWEEDGGYSAFTIAVQVAALLEAASLAEFCGEPETASYFRETADGWNAGIEKWIDPALPGTGFEIPALVRFGLRSPDDPLIATAFGTVDAGVAALPESPDRLLLISDRAYCELASGNRHKAGEFLAQFESSADALGLFPLARFHAGHIKLKRSVRDGHLFDRPPSTVQRYLVDKTGSTRASWRFNQKIRTMPSGKVLRIETQAAAVIHWTTDHWASMEDAYTVDTGLGMNIADLPTGDLETGRVVEFTFYWRKAGSWENRNFTVEVR